ncbi:MAG: DEAD/DEAH box helicase, partial [Lachnospiraceae bacterium]|nr:DEAD/DEAH box helicase [Lachnospiraceae bacterium]
IVCPASLVYNWDNEIRRFAPIFTTVVVSGSAQERKELIESSKDKDIFITSYDSLRRDMDSYREMEFSYQVIDEAQFIKNPATQNAKSVKEIKADVKFALTGTPIENRLSELWSIFDYLMPGFLYSYSVFRDEIENPIVKEEDRLALIRLQNMIKPFVLRRLKSDVLKDLPEKQEAVVYSKLGGEQLKLYAANVAQFKQEIMGLSAAEFATNRMHVLAQLMRLRQICCDPALCYDNYKDSSAKLDTCMELVRGAVESGHKILLFSQFTSMLDRIAKCFVEEGISYFTLTGDTPKKMRVKMAEEFNNDNTKVFLISLKAGGTGLNLTGADIVIHYDPWWNVAVQNQATDRAHRIGQKNKVNVYKLIAKDSIEEKILKLQESKEMLAESVVSDEVAKLTTLSKEELLKLLD